jgi:outer membrane protein assembly factor BamB
VVQDGRVVFTAPDGASVHCLNLGDGSLVWKAPRAADDLYLAGVAGGKVLIVGKRQCRALRLTDGSPLWQLATGLPSGQGVFSGHLYYLPLKEGRGHEPEVCTIDVDTGKDVAHTRPHRKEVPGNLVLVGGQILSQTVHEVAAYPQLKAKLRQMEALLARDPQDPVGLTERAELRLDDGDLAGAVRDLHAALRNNPPLETRTRARAQLYDALTQYLRQDFGAAEKYLDDYRDLCKVEVEARAPAEARRQAAAEERRRTGTYLMLVALGRERQGRLSDALRNCVDLASLAGHDPELVAVPGEAALRVRSDVWARGRVSALLARATPEQRQALDREIAALREAAGDARGTQKLEQFVVLFGDTAAGQEARLLLADRLAADRDFHRAEQQLLIQRGQTGDPPTAARATEALARFCAGKGLHEDAIFWYRALARDYPKVIVRDGKTGADFLKDLATDKRFLPYLEERDWPGAGGRVTVQIDKNGGGPPAQQAFHFEPDGEVQPSFRHLSVALEPQTHSLRLLDGNGSAVGHASLTRTQFFSFLQQQNPTAPGHGPRYAYHTVGHVIVLPVGHMVFGIDPLNKGGVLWEKSLLGAPGQPSNGTQVLADPNGSVQIVHADGFVQRLGHDLVRPARVCLLTQDGLVALDPLTGETLWTRADVRSPGEVFGDDRHVYLAELNSEGNPVATRAFRAADGVTAPDVPEFGAAFRQHRRLDGGRILAADNRDGKLGVRLYDVPTGKDVWEQECPAGSVVLQCEVPHLGGVLRPDGTLTVLDLPSAREVLTARVDPKDMGKAQGATLLRDRVQWYLAINGPRDANVGPWVGPFSNFLPSTGYRSVPVNGKVYAFDRATGAVKWETIELPLQMLVPEQFRDLPFLLLTSRYTKVAGAGPNRWATPSAALTVVDKRSGKLLKDEKDLSNAQQFHTLRIDLREGKVELVSFNLKVTLTLEPPRAPGR